MREAMYFTVYFPRRIGEVANEIKETLDEFLDFAPGVSLGHAGVKPSAGRYRRGLREIHREAFDLLDKSLRMGEDDNVHIAFKDGKATDFSSDEYHFIVYGENLVHIASQRTTLPNFVQCFFPIEGTAVDRHRFVDWFRTLVRRLGACYGFVNPVLDYDMFHPQRVINEVLLRLANNHILDVFDDFNHHRHLLDHVKGPMWVTALSQAHLTSLCTLESTQAYSVSNADNVKYVTIDDDPTASATAELHSKYAALAAALEPITIASFDPIMLRFPYKYPYKYSDMWLRRFRTNEWIECCPPSP